MNVYWVNCFLAVTLAFWAGYALDSRMWERRFVNMIAGLRAAVGKPPVDTQALH